MNRQPFLVAVGDNCVDYYVQTRTGYPGGNPVNVSVYFTRLGGRAAYIGAVGTDEGGALICDGLRRKNVDISHIHTVQGRTAVTRVALRDGDRVFLDYNEGVMADFTVTEADMDFLRTADMVVGGISGHGERYFPRIHSDGIPTAFDFSDEYDDPAAATIFPCVEVAFFSYEAAMRRASSDGCGSGARRSALPRWEPTAAWPMTDSTSTVRASCPVRWWTPWAPGTASLPGSSTAACPARTFPPAWPPAPSPAPSPWLTGARGDKKQPRKYPFTASTRAKCDHSPCH